MFGKRKNCTSREISHLYQVFFFKTCPETYMYMYMDDKHLIENILMGLVLFYRPSLPILTKRVKRNQVVCKAYCFSLTILVILININVPLTIIRKT